MVDRYTKVLLTIIAVSLVALVAQNSMLEAKADASACGIIRDEPCFVATGDIPIDVRIKR